MKDDERRETILRAAHEAFVELGFARTTTAEVARRARVSKRSIYELFVDKTQLFGEVVRLSQRAMIDLPRPEGEQLPLYETLVAIFRLNIDERNEREREAMLNLIAREATQFPELSDYLYTHNIIRSRELLIAWVEQQADRMPVDDPAMLTGMLMDIVFGALLPRRRLKTPEERKKRNEDIKRRIRIVLKGLESEFS